MYKQTVLATALALSIATSVHAAADDGLSPDTPPVVAGEGLSRWFTLDAASFTLRYRNSFDTDGAKIFDDIQQKSLLAGKLKLDKQGKYFIGFRAESGRYFNWSFANISGTDYSSAVTQAVNYINPQRLALDLQAYYSDPQAAEVLAHTYANGWQFYVRDLYLSATPVTGLTLEFGAIPIERGVGSEITTYDEDGYISGERVRIKYPKQLYLDQIEFTSAYSKCIHSP